MGSSPRAVAIVLLLVAAGCGGGDDPGASDTTFGALAPDAFDEGIVRRWPEATTHLALEVGASGAIASVGAARPTGIDAFWSIASTSGEGSGYFYADGFRATPETRVAYAAGARRAQDVRDAASLDFSDDAVGPVPAGGVVVVQHVPSGRYLVLVLDAITPADPRTAGAGPYAYADVTWTLGAAGVTDFGAAP